MLTGAETETRIKNNDLLVLPGFQLAPARFDEQGIADLNGFEMFLPGFSPVLCSQWNRLDFAKAKTAFAQDGQACRDFLLQSGVPLLAIDVRLCGCPLCSFIYVKGGRLPEQIFKRHRNGVLCLGRNGKRNFGERFIF